MQPPSAARGACAPSSRATPRRWRRCGCSRPRPASVGAGARGRSPARWKAGSRCRHPDRADNPGAFDQCADEDSSCSDGDSEGGSSGSRGSSRAETSASQSEEDDSEGEGTDGSTGGGGKPSDRAGSGLGGGRAAAAEPACRAVRLDCRGCRLTPADRAMLRHRLAAPGPPQAAVAPALATRSDDAPAERGSGG